MRRIASADSSPVSALGQARPVLVAAVGRPVTVVVHAAYRAVGDVDFGVILGRLGVSVERFTFVDLGSGKGRAILLASALPFKRIVGVEISEELTSIARRNLRCARAHARRCRDIELVCMDAADYVLPEEPVVLYLYNPFERSVMAQVVGNVSASFRSHPRRIVVLYFIPRLAQMWDQVAFLERKCAADGWAIYDSERTGPLSSRE